MIFTLKLLLAHLLGDFLLQPASWTKHKVVNGLASIYLYLHVLVHGMILLILLSGEWREQSQVILILVLSHLLIDAAKVTLEKRHSSSWWFWLDQLMHLIVIAAVVLWKGLLEFDLTFIQDGKFLVVAICLVMLTGVSSVVLKVIMTRWNVRSFSVGSLHNAGLYIGILERLFVFTFVIMDHWQAIGFLIAAKSAFRFGDLSKAKNKKLTEYVLIGTLISFGLAILIGLLYGQLIVLV